MSTSANRFVWFELMTSDVKAAQAFYGHVVGWRMQDAGMPFPYVLASPPGSPEGGGAVAGLMELTPEMTTSGMPPCWGGYIGVDDVDAAANRLAATGAQICKAPEDIPGVGRFAVMADPQGASFMLFKGSGDDMPTPPPPMAPGTIGWHELHAGEGVAAANWYMQQFGWTKDTAMDMGPAGVYQLFAIDGAQAGGIMTKMPQQPVPAWLYYFCVDSITAAEARIKASGGQVINGPMEVPGGNWIVNAIDPQGAMFALVGPKT